MASRMKSARSKSGKLADLVLWKPAFFGVKPELVIKGGMIAWAAMGDANASIPTPAAGIYRPMFGGFRRRVAETSLTFVSKAALDAGIQRRLGLMRKRAVAVSECRNLRKRDMINNNALPKIEVDPETYEVRADGELLTCEPADICRWRSVISCSSGNVIEQIPPPPQPAANSRASGATPGADI